MSPNFRIGRAVVRVVALVVCLCVALAHGRGVRVEVTPDMLDTADVAGEPWMLFDEPGDEAFPPSHEPSTVWHPGWKADSHPASIQIDLGRQRDLTTIALFDLNADGEFLIESGLPGDWTALLTDDCRAYKQWRHHVVNVRTRYLRLTRREGGANVAEVILYERSPQEQQARREAANRPLVDAGPLFGRLPLVDEIVCGDPADPHILAEEPKASTRIETLLGRPCRTLPPTEVPAYFAYRLGKGKWLEPGKAYVLSIDYPQDRPRTLWIANRGCETEHGLHTGPTVGDALKPKYVSSNPESLEIPLSGRHETWRMLFFLHDRFADIELPRGEGPRPMEPEDGFWLIFSQPDAASAPRSAGLAVSRIRLLEVPDPERFYVRSTLPPDLPKRRLFFREEMGDGCIASADPGSRGVADTTAWYEYKARLMSILGMNTYCKDLLEFGHNQGWDAGRGWYNQARDPLRWQNILAMLARYNLDVLPYYEYAGSIGPGGLGSDKRCRTLAGTTQYTHVAWTEKANADITDPDTLADAKKLLDYTIVRHKDKANFVGAWFRPRPSAIPVSFSDRCLRLFSDETRQPQAVTRERLQSDSALLDRYYDWWYRQRRAFLVTLRDHLRSAGLADPLILYTTDASESGLSFPRWDAPMVAENPAPWRKLGQSVVSLDQVIAEKWYDKALVAPRLTWGEWEWQHACPANDPDRYANTPGVLLTYTFNRAYTVASSAAMDRFRTPSGLAMIRHWCLNEDMLDKKTGYFVCDVERAGPFVMLAEARALAAGDPWYIGYLAGGTFNRGDLEYVRAFNRAYLALPALPSRIVPNACADEEVVVRAIPTQDHGTWYAVINTGYEEKQVNLTLPANTPIKDALTGQKISAPLTLYPAQLRALRTTK